MPRKPRDPRQVLPLTTLDFQVLTLLASRPLHGYGIVQASGEEFPDQPVLDLGSLYRIVSRMADGGLIGEVKPPFGAPKDHRIRRYYQVTDLGRAVARAEAHRLRSLLASPATLALLEAGR
jgi:DNA-binding PadR family transcriptional regulator